MKVWLIQPGEELPIDHGYPRLLRAGILADMLADQGHKVTYWSSTFSHARKSHRSQTDTEICVRENYKIRLINGPGYRKNVSIKRVYDHSVLANKFSAQAYLEPRPDVILCSMPTIELSLSATEYGQLLGCPVVLDIQDLWPDLFLEEVPRWARGIGRVFLNPMFGKLKKACVNATAIFGITEAFLNWGLKHAGRKRNFFDSVFCLGYRSMVPGDCQIEKAYSFWKRHGRFQDENEFIVCFFGYLGRQFEMETVLKAARALTDTTLNIRFVLCGEGDNFDYYKAIATNLNNVLFPGFVGFPEIWTLMRMASVGLAPYKNTPNFTANIPNKIGEYLSAGLPIVSSLSGTVQELLKQNQCGITYLEGDADNLVMILSDLYQNREKLGNMAKRSSKLFQEQFDADKVYAKMIKHLEHIAQECCFSVLSLK